MPPARSQQWQRLLQVGHGLGRVAVEGTEHAELEHGRSLSTHVAAPAADLDSAAHGDPRARPVSRPVDRGPALQRERVCLRRLIAELAGESDSLAEVSAARIRRCHWRRDESETGEGLNNPRLIVQLAQHRQTLRAGFRRSGEVKRQAGYLR
jgi:hypothetical protein